MNDYARDLFSLSTYINHLQIILSRYLSKNVGLKIALFPIFLLCLVFLLVAITPVFFLGLIVKLFFEILIDDLVEKGGAIAMVAYVVFMEFFLLMFIILGLEFILYSILKLLSLCLGKTANEAPIETIYKVNEKKEEKTDNIYVIDDEEFK